MKRVLVANRGEIAVRVIRACHELGLEAVAVYSTADREGAWVRLADRAVCIGPPSARESYLNQSNVIGAAETTGCDALHPGYGFLSESPSFVRACEDNDLIFVGPTAESMEVLGDKSLAKGAMRDAGMPLVPGSEGRLAGVDEARRVAAEVGYPVLLKAASGGGGRGMRPVAEPSELEGAYATATAEAQAAFDDGGLYLEKIVVDAHHIEVQVLGDGDGGALVLGERECSVQRRHQKLLEESPSPFLSDEARGAAVRRRARRRARDALPQRRHDRVPARRRPVLLLHGDEHASPGRAPGERGGDRHRPRALAAAARHGRAAAGPGHRARRTATRSSSASTPRIRRAASCRRRARCAASARRSGAACASTRTPTRATRCRRPTTRSSPS